MDQYNPMDQNAESAWDAAQPNPWNDPANIIQRHVAHLIRNANVHNDRVTAGGDRDMNAALVESARATLYLSVALELRGLLAEISDAQTAESQERNRLSLSAARRAYEQGVADGMDKASQAHEREKTKAEDASSFDLTKLDALQILMDGRAVRVVDGMDGSGELVAHPHTLLPEQSSEDAVAGTYIRLTVRQSEGDGLKMVDLSAEQWSQLRQAVDTLIARHLVEDAKAGGES